jgi:hypothetical protein
VCARVHLWKSAQSSCELLVDLKAHGLIIAPELQTWRSVSGGRSRNRPRNTAPALHRAQNANVLDKMPKYLQPAAKADPGEIGTVSGHATAEVTIATVAEKRGPINRQREQPRYPRGAKTFSTKRVV